MSKSLKIKTRPGGRPGHLVFQIYEGDGVMPIYTSSQSYRHEAQAYQAGQAYLDEKRRLKEMAKRSKGKDW